MFSRNNFSSSFPDKLFLQIMVYFALVAFHDNYGKYICLLLPASPKAKAGLGAAPLSSFVSSFVRSSVRNTLGVPVLCNLKLKGFSFLSIETWHIDRIYIENVHLLFLEIFFTSVWKLGAQRG